MNTKKKHTPGPWDSKIAFDQSGWVVRWSDKRGEHMRRLDDNGRFTEADARLIAAAPEMLEALVDLSNYVRDEQMATDGAVQYSTAQIDRLAFKSRAAIAKATGGAAP